MAVASSPEEAGSVEIFPAGQKFTSYSVVTLRAVPHPGYVFERWSGEIDVISDATQNPVTFVIGDTPDNTRDITANFTRSDARCTVSVFATPSAGGSVILEPSQPEEGYLINETVLVRGVANQGYAFSRWLGALMGPDNPRSILVNEDKSITALFNPTVSVYCSPPGGGSVSLQPESAGGYGVGTEVTLTATPAKGYRFAGWEGDASGSARSVIIIVNEAKTVTARFAQESGSRWWLWVVIGTAGLLGALILIRLVHARINNRYQDEVYEPEQ
ncbi:MAG: InlB B-repeat-containing protein [Dehalococcoidia bacterium]|nr:InlB B-repeat-containing protein [Dehalococcoidia bacterium]